MSAQGVESYFIFIKNRVSADWKDLAWCLGFRRPDIDNIDTKHRDDKSRCMDLLQEWHKLKGNAATIHVLMEALQDAELQHVVDSLKDKYNELKEEQSSSASGPFPMMEASKVPIQGQVQTARGETDQVLVLSLTGEITRLTQEKEKAQKQQKLEIQQLQEYGKATEAEIEVLTAEITKLCNQVADIPELRDEVRKLREKDETSQNVLSELRQEMQQLKDIIKTRNEAIEEKDRALREKDRALREKDMALREKDRALREK
ncbi:microtubule-associated protein 1A-like [Branchiostoma floridae]|uniref:Microtubule-associated protein 1A-like n=1 Tax=Branchiostoma floridae TaxID=7739 RepID=A0A9J7N9I8_BRAFL|nr:microtubule-associated protein 1A-like [Branchiostoma floridae]